MAAILFFLIVLALLGIQWGRPQAAYICIGLAFLWACFLLYHHVDFGSLNIDI